MTDRSRSEEIAREECERAEKRMNIRGLWNQVDFDAWVLRAMERYATECEAAARLDERARCAKIAKDTAWGVRLPEDRGKGWCACGDRIHDRITYFSETPIERRHPTAETGEEGE